jgi:hypothetical protein
VWIDYFPTAWYQRLVGMIYMGTNQDQSFATLFSVVNQSLPAICDTTVFIFISKKEEEKVTVFRGIPRALRASALYFACLLSNQSLVLGLEFTG